MNTRAKTTYLLTILLLGLLLCAWPTIGISKEGRSNGTEAGHIVAGSGRLLARADDGSERRLRRRSAIYAGDTIIVGDNAFIQIRFTDGGLTSLRPGTEFRVSEYNFNGEQDGSEKAMFDLVKGGLRTITGTIGKQNKKNYQLNTPVSTIGIRGTHYGVNLCDTGCQSTSGEPLPAGLYGGVVDGAIVVTTDGGEGLFGNDRYFHVADSNSSPQELLGPPGVVFDPIEVQSQPEQEEQTDAQAPSDGGQTASDDQPATDSETAAATGTTDATEFDATGANSGEVAESTLVEQPTSVDPGAAPGATDTGTTTLTSTTTTGSTTTTAGTGTTTTTTPILPGLTPAPLGAATAIAGVPPLFGPEPFAEIVPQKGDPTDEVYLDANGMVAQIIHRESPDCSPDCMIHKGTATLSTDGLPAGGFTLIEPGETVYWGRWEGDWYGQDSNGGGPGQGSWHFIYSPDVTHQAELDNLQVNGVVATFSQWSPGDGTIPTDENGNLGTYIGTPRFNVDFGTSEITNYQVSVNFAATGRTFYGMQPSIQPAGFIGPGTYIPLDVSCTGCAVSTGTGEATVVFTGTNATHAISSYQMSAGTNDAVGTILFTDDSLP